MMLLWKHNVGFVVMRRKEKCFSHTGCVKTHLSHCCFALVYYMLFV